MPGARTFPRAALIRTALIAQQLRCEIRAGATKLLRKKKNEGSARSPRRFPRPVMPWSLPTNRDQIHEKTALGRRDPARGLFRALRAIPQRHRIRLQRHKTV